MLYKDYDQEINLLLGDYSSLQSFKKEHLSQFQEVSRVIYSNSLKYYTKIQSEDIFISSLFNFPEYKNIPLFFSQEEENTRKIEPVFFEDRFCKNFSHPFEKYLYKKEFHSLQHSIFHDELLFWEKKEDYYYLTFNYQQFKTKNFISDLLKPSKNQGIFLRVSGNHDQDLILKKEHFFLGNLKESWFITFTNNLQDKNLVKILKELKSLLKKSLGITPEIEALFLQKEHQKFFLRP